MAKEEGTENRILILIISILSYSTRMVTANLARHIHWSDTGTKVMGVTKHFLTRFRAL